MSTKKVDLGEFSKALGQWATMSLQQQKQSAARGLAKSIPDLVAASPVDTGLYASSWDFKIDEKSAIIGNYAPYAGVIEYGARPFTPPLGPLLAWAKRVLTGSKEHDTGQPETSYTPEVQRLARAVQKKISERGMEPRHILENALPMIIENIKSEMRRA